MNDINKTIEKLKYQIGLLSSTIDSDKYPIEVLVLTMGWDESDLDNAHDIFEKYDQKIEKEDPNINWTKFEHELRDRFDIGYQTVKRIINAFYKNDQWIDVCYRYSKAYTCVEFHGLIRNYENLYPENVVNKKI